MAIITISRQIGSLGDELAEFLADKLSCGIISRQYALDNFFGELPSGVVDRLNESAKFFMSPIKGNDVTYKDVLMERLEEMCADKRREGENVIVLGLGGSVIFGNDPYVINLRVTASDKTRIGRITKRYNVDLLEAEQIVTIGDRKQKRFVSTLFEQDLNDGNLYDLTFNTDYMSVNECAAVVLALIKERDLANRIREEVQESSAEDHQTESVVFKNDTEAEFAHILDMYKIEWKYEPKTFPIEWDSEGNVKMAFSPDFYLPKFDTYLELTTMDQKYVTTKNKKLRMVRELYPGTNIRIVYKKDFVELVERLKQFDI